MQRRSPGRVAISEAVGYRLRVRFVFIGTQGMPALNLRRSHEWSRRAGARSRSACHIPVRTRGHQNFDRLPLENLDRANSCQPRVGFGKPMSDLAVVEGAGEFADSTASSLEQSPPSLA
jgi:hypothetical protein